MGIGKQAKVLTPRQIDLVDHFLSQSRNSTRDRVVFLLSVRAGLRAKEIAELKWSMVTDAEGHIAADISLPNRASKGSSGRVVPLNSALRRLLIEWRDEQRPRSDYVVSTQRSSRTTAQTVVSMFWRWYGVCGLDASSHSGRRTAITNWARKISTVGGSLRDVQRLAGHASLGMTQRYIDHSPDAQRRVVELN